ncbi:MAG: agmatinase [Solirubrobacterales bacterium]|jgi:agmatinase|nr:agmatinase [Solirubrobacterales bacterium]
MATIDPNARWGADGRPDYAGLPSFAALPYTESGEGLAGADVAIVGAPMDELVSDRPGTRYGPRAIRQASASTGRHLDAGIDAFESLRVVDFGDAAVIPADPVASHAAIERIVGEVVDAGAIPLVLGGDHSIAEPDIRACAQRHGPLGLIHFDAHTDTARELWGAELSHGTPMYRLVEQGHVAGERYAQIGLRGYWPGEKEFAWQRERGITELRMREVVERGIADVLTEAIDAVGPGPAFASIDIDVLDPAFAPGTGTPEPGGMTTADLLWACRELAGRLELVGADVVEVLPSASGTDVTAVVGARIAHELLTGIALRRAGRGGA